jgi:hypothetical protein
VEIRENLVWEGTETGGGRCRGLLPAVVCCVPAGARGARRSILTSRTSNPPTAVNFSKAKPGNFLECAWARSCGDDERYGASSHINR